MTIRTKTLPNGFTIATEFMPNFKTAALGIWIRAGGRHETEEQNGIAHFLEHMAFKGTKNRTSFQIAEAIEHVGGYINAYTSREITNYYCRVLSEHVPLAMDVISDIVLNSTIEQTEVNVERGVILQEIGQSNDTPDDIIFDWLQETAYPDQPYGRSILGPAANVKAFSSEDLINFTQLHYSPNKMILCAAGDIDHDDIVNLSKKYFLKLSKKAEKRIVPGIFVGGERRVYKDLEQAHFALSFKSSAIKDSDIFVSQIFAVAMGGGMSSKLFQEIREKRGLCYSIFSSIDAGSDTGSFTIYAGTSEDKINELSTVVIDELKRSIETISQKDLDKARAQIKAGLLMGLESTSNRCERLARMLSVWRRIIPLSETIKRIEEVTLLDLRGFAERIFSSSNPALALYGPIKKAPSLEKLKDRLAS
ncbi:MAG: peptidase M16 [Rhodobacteraceae bacterium]|nr:MAG: peptidase M16 [Paracoccaceae bacterium]